jgi:hypothetical protein
MTPAPALTLALTLALALALALAPALVPDLTKRRGRGLKRKRKRKGTPRATLQRNDLRPEQAPNHPTIIYVLPPQQAP